MQIELIGCTSAGKSTLARSILQVAREQGLYTLMADEFVLGQIHLNWVKARLARTFWMDLLFLFACLATWRKNRVFCLFTIRIIRQLPGAVPWLEKLNIARNVFKNVGIYEIVRWRSSDEQVILVDEGTLHTAHYLFVHVCAGPDASDLSTYARLVPLPGVVIRAQQDEAVLIERTLARGHKRIPNGSNENVERFVRRAVYAFDWLLRQLVVEGRLSVVDGLQEPYVAQNTQHAPLPAAALNIIGSGQDRLSRANATGATSGPTARKVQPAPDMLA